MVLSRSVLKAVVVVGAASSTLAVALPARMNTANGEAGPLATAGNTPHSEAAESVPRRTAVAPSYRGVPPPPPPAPPAPEDHRNKDHRGRELDSEAPGNDFTVGNAAVTLSNRGTPPTHRPGTPTGGSSSTKAGRPKLSSRGSPPPPPPPPPPPRYPLFGAFSRPKDFRRRALDRELQVAAENDVTGRTAATLSYRGTPPPPPPAPPVPKGHRNNGHQDRELDSETSGNDFTGGGTVVPLTQRGIPPPPPIPKTEAFKHKDFRDREPHLEAVEGFSGRTGATLSSRGYPPPPAPAPPVPKHEGSKNKSHRGRELDSVAAGNDATGGTAATLSSRRTPPPPPPPPPPVPKAKALGGRDLDAIVEDDDSESDSHHGHYEPFGEEHHYDHLRHHYPYEDEVDVEEGYPDHYHRLPYGADLD